MTTIYHYSPKTFELIGNSTADNDPLDDLPMIPAMATADAPPATGSNQVAIFTNNAWSVVDDFRDYVGFDAAGVEQKIEALGIAPDVTWTISKPFVLDDAVEGKKNDIRTAFNTAEQLPVTDGNGIIWSGGYNSALKMDAANRMAQMAGLTTVSLFDAANVEHVLAIADAEMVVLTLGADFQAKFAQKQALMVAVDALPNTATQADLDAIVVAF